jgi:hypothetical protein
MPEQLFPQALSFQALEVLELIDQSGATPIEADGVLEIGTAQLAAVFGELAHQGLLDWEERSGDPRSLPHPAAFPSTHFQLSPLARSLRNDHAFNLQAVGLALGAAPDSVA